jgi:Xaa-Pro aminopeptidase
VTLMEAKRMERLRSSMEEQGIEALWITNAMNRKYMTGFTGSAGYVLITAERAILFTDFRYMTQAPQQAKYYEVIEHRASVIQTLKETLQKLRISNISFEQNDVSYGTYLSYKEGLGDIGLQPVEALVEHLRMQKDETEIAVLQEAADLADQTFSHILTFLKPGVSEREIALELEVYMRKHGAVSSSFEIIVASGERSALPHGIASDRILQNNEFVKMDFGAYYKGYCSDITRTVVLGTLTPKHREIYEIVLEAQSHALEHIKPGMSGKEADALTRDIIKRYGYNDYFGHGTGHGLGMEIHEAPRLSPTSHMILKPGMTVTVEPGIYLPDFGGVRIEDDIVITDSGIKILTHSTKKLICID